MSTFAEWQLGNLTDIEALRSLWSDLREIESEIAPLDAQKTALREQIGHIVARTGTIALPGLGKASFTNPSVTYSYDTKKLDALLLELAESQPDLVARFTKTRKVSERAGSLRIESEKAP